MLRLPEDCPHLHSPQLHSANQADSKSYCRFLQSISGVVDVRRCEVTTELCQNCCRYAVPDAERMNPVIASKLYDLSANILKEGGTEGCDIQLAESLNRMAKSRVMVDRGFRPRKAPLPTQTPSIVARLDPRTWRSQRVRRWSVGITTSPRRQPTLGECIESVRHSGWSSPRLFVDGRFDLPSNGTSLPTTTRDIPVGAWPNYFLSLAELIMRDPAADAFLVLQDDALICRYSGLREYLETVLWPNGRAGIASLYCSGAYTQPKRGWYRYRGRWQWGGLAFLFSRPAAQRFLRDRYVIMHRWRSTGRVNIDGVIGRWAHRRRIPLYFPTPSLVQHIGETSTVWRGSQADHDRQADWFAAGVDDLP